VTRKHRLLPGIIKMFAVLTAVAAIIVIVERLTINVTSIAPEKMPGNAIEQTVHAMGKPNLWLLPVLWKSGEIKGLFRGLMVALSFVGCLKIGMLLSDNRERLGRAHRRRARTT
jgi:hypothetical protein